MPAVDLEIVFGAAGAFVALVIVILFVRWWCTPVALDEYDLANTVDVGGTRVLLDVQAVAAGIANHPANVDTDLPVAKTPRPIMPRMFWRSRLWTPNRRTGTREGSTADHLMGKMSKPFGWGKKNPGFATISADREGITFNTVSTKTYTRGGAEYHQIGGCTDCGDATAAVGPGQFFTDENVDQIGEAVGVAAGLRMAGQDAAADAEISAAVEEVNQRKIDQFADYIATFAAAGNPTTEVDARGRPAGKMKRTRTMVPGVARVVTRVVARRGAEPPGSPSEEDSFHEEMKRDAVQRARRLSNVGLVDLPPGCAPPDSDEDWDDVLAPRPAPPPTPVQRRARGGLRRVGSKAANEMDNRGRRAHTKDVARRALDRAASLRRVSAPTPSLRDRVVGALSPKTATSPYSLVTDHMSDDEGGGAGQLAGAGRGRSGPQRPLAVVDAPSFALVPFTGSAFKILADDATRDRPDPPVVRPGIRSIWNEATSGVPWISFRTGCAVPVIELDNCLLVGMLVYTRAADVPLLDKWGVVDIGAADARGGGAQGAHPVVDPATGTPLQCFVRNAARRRSDPRPLLVPDVANGDTVMARRSFWDGIKGADPDPALPQVPAALVLAAIHTGAGILFPHILRAVIQHSAASRDGLWDLFLHPVERAAVKGAVFTHPALPQLDAIRMIANVDVPVPPLSLPAEAHTGLTSTDTVTPFYSKPQTPDAAVERMFRDANGSQQEMPTVPIDPTHFSEGDLSSTTASSGAGARRGTKAGAAARPPARTVPAGPRRARAKKPWAPEAP